jgi:amino acid adenylation domain-containing protein
MRFPASFAQQRLWFLEQLDPGEPTWNMPYAIWLDGPLDRQALQRALDATAARQAALRTTIVAFDGVPELVVADTGTMPIELIELDPALPEDEWVRRAQAIATERSRQPFDLATGPLIRATLIGAGPGRHLFLLVMHHSISDGESVKVLIGDLAASYRAETGGPPAALAELWMEYGDYTVWQQGRMRGEELDRQLEYWRERLAGAPLVLALPTDRPRPARMSARGGQARVTIDAATTGRLAALAKDASVTMFMVCLTGFAAVLSRCARQPDMVVGTQVAGRTHGELDPLVGLFTNAVPLRLSLHGDPTFAGLLSQVRDTTLDAMLHQDVPFEKLVDEFVPKRTLAVPALIQAQFLYGSLTPPELDLPGLTERSEALLTGTTKLDLTMFADGLDGETITLTLEYSTDLWDQAWADQFTRCVATLLEHAATAPGTAVADLPMLTDAERDALIIGRNRQDLPPGDVEAADVRRLVQASPSLVISGDETRPASEVCDQAARIARVLAGHGAGPDTPVGLCTGRGTGMLAALLGVWWAGGGYVPLDPGFPAARLATMARFTGLRVIISDAAHRDLAQSAAPDATVVCVDDPATAAAEPLAPVAVPENALAYVIFTSGSTGQPKGVAITHRGVASQLAAFRRLLRLGRDDRFVAITTPSFDISVIELLLPLVCGADVVIAATEDGLEADRLQALIKRTGATVLQGTPQTWRLLESAGGIPAGLRLRLSGGEALPPDLAEALLAPGTELWNLYGPTETTVWATASVVTSAATATEIGPPIDHMRVYVLDERLMPVPPGVVGEVCLAGRGVGRGYYGKPQLTAGAFRPDPWSDEPGARLYRTGDLGRWRPGPGLELIGRNDHQVKIRGFRIECGEIEAVLRGHRDVRQAAVISADRGGEPALVAYVVPRRNSAVAQPGADLLEVLRPHLRAKLPDYMIPAVMMALPALPLTPTAKVDRRALPVPRWGAPPSAVARDQPASPVETTLAQIWGELLSTEEPVGVHDSLFALGGHSLTATRLVARVVDTYGVKLPVHLVFARPTIAELAEAITADPDFGAMPSPSPARHAELEALSDSELDDLLRAATALRNRRRAAAAGSDA